MPGMAKGADEWWNGAREIKWTYRHVSYYIILFNFINNVAYV